MCRAAKVRVAADAQKVRVAGPRPQCTGLPRGHSSTMMFLLKWQTKQLLRPAVSCAAACTEYILLWPSRSLRCAAFQCKGREGTRFHPFKLRHFLLCPAYVSKQSPSPRATAGCGVACRASARFASLIHKTNRTQNELCKLYEMKTNEQVRSSRGDVTGVLDIAKCLYDAVSRLQRTAKRRSVDSGDANEAEMSMLAELGKGKGKKSKAAMQVSRGRRKGGGKGRGRYSSVACRGRSFWLPLILGLWRCSCPCVFQISSGLDGVVVLFLRSRLKRRNCVWDK